jgi:hypothetical protein
MNASRYLLIVIAAIAAAISAAPVLAKSGQFDPNTDGARSSYSAYTDGARTGKYNAFTDGAKTGGKFDTYTDGARYVFSTDEMPH